MSLQNARILIVDDEAANVRILTRMLAGRGYHNVVGETDAATAVENFAGTEPDLVLLDLNMPGLDGFGVLERIRELVPEGSYMPVLVITGVPSPEVRQRALSLGAKDFVGKPFDVSEILLRIRNLLETRMLHRSLEEKVRQRTAELETAKLDVLRRLARAAEFRDDDTGQHTQRVGELAARLAQELGLDVDAVRTLRLAAPLHDVGKIGIPDSILLKPGRLTAEEFEVIKTHTTIGADLLAGGESELLCAAEEIALSHHEMWDGGGYPRGLAGEAIPIAARIVAVADFHDALSHARTYRDAWPHERIVEEMRRQSGRHFDPQVLAALWRIMGPTEPTAQREPSRSALRRGV